MSWKFDTAARRSVSRADAPMIRHAANAEARSWGRSGSVSDALDAWDDYSQEPTPFNVGKYLKHI